MTETIKLNVEDGKYTVCYTPGEGPYILRYGEPWLEPWFPGCNCVASMAIELDELRKENSKLKSEIVDVKNQLKDAEDEIQHIFYDMSMQNSRFCLDE